MTRKVELKLYAYRKNRDGLIVSFVVHPSDEGQLQGVDIGDVFDAVLTESSDGARDAVKSPSTPEEPAPGPAPSDGERIRTRAVMLCKDRAFKEWLTLNQYEPDGNARNTLAQQIGLNSLADLPDNPEAQKRFLLMEAQYRLGAPVGVRCQECKSTDGHHYMSCSQYTKHM
jgi:hypothetical protein